MPTVLSFKNTGNKHIVYRGKDCIETFCKYLREHATKKINFKKRKVKLLTKEQENQMKMRKSVISVKKNLETNISKIKNILKLEIIDVIKWNIGALHITYIFKILCT